MEPLLAKSAREGRDPKTLLEHTTDVVAAGNALFTDGAGPSRLGRAWLRFFGLGEEEFGRFLKHLRVAAVLHDWGKANDGFEDAVKRNESQVVRHEHLSALVLADLLKEAGIRKWLEGAGIDHGVVMAAVVSHHAKAGAEGSDNMVGGFVGLREVLRLAAGHPDFATVWRMAEKEVGSACPVPVDFGKRWGTGLWRKADIESRRTALRDGFGAERKKLRQDEGRRKLLAAVRAGLIVADAVGSAVVRMLGEEGEESRRTIERWVRQCFEQTLTGQEVWEKVVKRRIADLRARGRWDDTKEHSFGDEQGFSEFQCKVAAMGPRVLMMAPCGAGKTLAAWNWITAQLNARPAVRPIARVLFLYPTRATATEGFRDYVSWAPEDDAGLMSGTADYDLQGMFDNPPDGKGDERGERDYRSDPRLYALGNWSKRIFSATADQFFPFLQYGYGPLCGLPLLAESIVVVDEAHSFDESMFATLKRFLTAFPDVPVLCMTATLSANRRADLVERCGLVPYPEVTPPDTLHDSSYKRYCIQWIGREDAEWIALGALAARERVLWVSNRVADCQEVYTSVNQKARKSSLYCYHSRFKLEDRRTRHNELVQEFQKAARDEESAGILGVTTQVCEMSLDLDAQVLITECAPISSLIQRMGRCNRDPKKMRGRPAGRVYVIRPAPGKEKPYEKDELRAAERFVSELSGKLVSQDELEAAYRLCDTLKVETDKHTPFLDSGPFADGTEATFREGDEFTVPCVLDRDLDAVKQAIERRQPIDAFTVPVPKRHARPLPPNYSRLPRWLSVAPSNHYDSMTGFGDRARGNEQGENI